MSLQYTTESQRVVAYHELERFINETLQPSVSFNILADQEWGNDHYQMIHVDNQHGLLVNGMFEKRHGASENDLRQIRQWLEQSKPSPFMLTGILTDLCAKSFIKPGKYLIDICW